MDTDADGMQCNIWSIGRGEGGAGKAKSHAVPPTHAESTQSNDLLLSPSPSLRIQSEAQNSLNDR